jgi:hypothetical protein
MRRADSQTNSPTSQVCCPREVGIFVWSEVSTFVQSPRPLSDFEIPKSKFLEEEARDGEEEAAWNL